MHHLVLSPGRVGPLLPYLRYLFLRYPGELGVEERLTLDCFDTYDHRWLRKGQIWIRLGAGLTLVSPPALNPLPEDPSAFGLQAPVPVGKVTVRQRTLTLGLPEGTEVRGFWLKTAQGSFLVISRGEGRAWDSLEAALLADGLAPTTGLGWAAPLAAKAFDGPRELALPAPGSAATVFLVDHLREGLRVARLYEAGIRKDVDTECLHQYRVFLRRVRSLVALKGPWEVVPERTRLKNVLRQLQQQTNALRDLDVLILDLPSLRSRLPWDEGSRLGSWEDGLRRRRKAELRRVKGWLESDDHRSLHEEVERLFEDLLRYGEPWTIEDLVHSALDHSCRSLRRSLNQVENDPADLVLHEVRIQAKRLRYTLDPLGPLVPSAPVKALLGLLKQSQEGLGRFQDRAVLMSHLRQEREILAKKGTEVDLIAFGVLVGTLAAEHPRLKDEALADARNLRSKAFRRALRDLVPRSPEAPRGT